MEGVSTVSNFKIGSLIWASVAGYGWWPGQVRELNLIFDIRIYSKLK